MNDKIKVFSLGGLDERGKNMYVVEINDDIFVFDCGSKYPNKTLPGVDSLIPNIDYLKANKERVRAYFISHGHDDKYGALPYIYKEVPAPIITSKFTAEIIELQTKKLHIKNNYVFDYISGSETKVIAGHRMTFVQVIHSIPFSFCAMIETSEGTIVYYPDCVIDFSNLPEGYNFSFEAMRQLSSNDCLLLMMDSTNAHLPGHASPDYNITPKIRKYFETSNGKIFCALYGQNYYALREVLELCYANKKTVVFLNDEDGDYYYNVIKNFHNTSDFSNVTFESFNNINRISNNNTVVLLINEGTNLFKDIISFCNGSVNRKSLEFSPNDTFIMCCPPVAANEIIATEALDNVYKTGCKIINLTKKEMKKMHACQEDIKSVLGFFKPKFYLPISGSYSNLMTNANVALSADKHFNYSNIFVLDNGVTLNYDNGRFTADFKNIIHTGDVLIDGTDVGSISSNVIEERNKMANDGVVLLGASISKKDGQIVGGPDVQMRGFVFVKDSENIVKNITEIFLDQVKTYLAGYGDEKYMQSRCIDKISQYLYKETRKSPVILPTIIDID